MASEAAYVLGVVIGGAAMGAALTIVVMHFRKPGGAKKFEWDPWFWVHWVLLHLAVGTAFYVMSGLDSTWSAFRMAGFMMFLPSLFVTSALRAWQDRAAVHAWQVGVVFSAALVLAWALATWSPAIASEIGFVAPFVIGLGSGVGAGWCARSTHVGLGAGLSAWLVSFFLGLFAIFEELPGLGLAVVTVLAGCLAYDATTAWEGRARKGVAA